MGKMSREKGKTGEREFAALCREYGFDAKRTAQHMGKDGGMADVIGLPGIHVEVKRTERLNLSDAMAQAIRDTGASGKTPIVAHRKNRESWLVTLSAADFLRMQKELCALPFDELICED